MLFPFLQSHLSKFPVAYFYVTEFSLSSFVWPWLIKSNCTTSQTVKSKHNTSIRTWTGVTTVYSPSFPLSLGMFHKSLSNWLVRKWSSFWMVKFTFVSICTLFSIWTRRWRITSSWLDAQEVVQCWTRSSQWIVRRHKPSLRKHHM